MVQVVADPPRYLAPASKRRAFDPVAAIETAYRLDLDERDWLAELLSTLLPVCERGFGVSAWTWSYDAGALHVRNPTYLECPLDLHAAHVRAAELLSGHEIVRAHTLAACCTMSAALGLGATITETPSVREGMRPMVGAQDSLMLQGAESLHRGLVISASSRELVKVAPKTKALLSRVTAHIMAGRRLRRLLRREQAGIDAVLSAEGALLHAEPPLQSTARRHTLVSAAREIQQSRGALRHEAPDRAVALWRGLVNGEWSVVDHVDTDGKRLIVARRNAPGIAEPAALRGEERAVATLAALGHSSKLIAYELGRSESVISERLKSAVRKLGLRNRSELVRLVTARSV
jgi:DNA-binding NarL/FixJ family response regulator